LTVAGNIIFKVPPLLFTVVAGVVGLAVVVVAAAVVVATAVVVTTDVVGAVVVEEVAGIVVEVVVPQDIDNPSKDKAITESRKYLNNFIYSSLLYIY